MSEKINLKIEGLSEDGTGYGYHQKNKYFVANTLPGDEIIALPLKHTSKYNLAELVRLVKPSDHRQTPNCPFFPQCGGCVLRHCDAQGYDDHRLRILQQQLSYAHFPVESAKIQWLKFGDGQRRRIHLQYQQQFGLFSSHSQTLVPLDHCLNVTAKINELLAVLNKLEVDFEGLKGLEITELDDGLVCNFYSSTPLSSSMVELFRTLPSVINISVTTKQHTEVLWQSHDLLLRLKDLTLSVPPEVFLQASQQAQDTMIDLVLQELRPYQKVADLYSGIGTFGLPLAHYLHQQVSCYEGQPSMVQALQRYLLTHPLPLKAKVRDLVQLPLTVKELAKFQAVVLDPPRSGASIQLKQLSHSKVEKIVYISCDINSLSKDLRLLAEDYVLDRVYCLDQFYCTKHQEILVSLSRK